MKRKLSIVNCQLSIKLSIVLMLGATSCEKEILDNGQAAGIALADGQFIVEYSGEPRTRAIHEDVEKGARINSLTYLLYQDQGGVNSGMANATLVKRREIPDLDGHEESWPLTRENMTWEQREALKDTLSVGNTYYAVFVANADASLWDDTSPLKNADLPATEGATAPTYSAAYLQLSSDVPFDDHNMFYLATETIDGTTASREHPQDCPITLRRIVTRTDWWFERLPEWDILQDEVAENDTYIYKAEPGEGDLKLPEGVEGYIENLVSDLFSDIWYSHLSVSIQEDTDDFLTALVEYFTAQGFDSENQEWTNQAYQSYVNAIETVKTSLEAGGEGLGLYLNNVLNGKGSSEALMNLVTNNFIVDYANNLSIRAEWSASWRNGLYAQLQYDETNNPQGDRYWLNGTVTHGDESTDTSPYIKVDITNSELVDRLTFDGFHFIGLANPELNVVQQINWYKYEEETFKPLTALEIPSEIPTNEQGVNERYQILYRPMVSLTLKDTWESESTSLVFTCNLAKSLPFTFEEGGLTSAELFEAINDALKSGDEALSKYANSTISAFPFTLSVPDLSKEACFDIMHKWDSPVRVY